MSDFALNGSASRLRIDEGRICLDLSLHAYPRTTIAWAHLSSCVPSLLTAFRWVGSLPEGSSPLATRTWFGRAHVGTGISTSCASTTPVGLALAPDLPWADEPSPGTLGHSAEGFLPPLSLLMPAFALDRAPRRFTPTLRCTIDAPLPISCEMTQLRLHA